MVVVDALLWFGAPLELVSWLPEPDSAQLLLRALIFRLMALSGRARATGEPMDDLPLLAGLFSDLVG